VEARGAVEDDSYMDTGPYGVNINDNAKKSSFVKRLPLQNEICFGDYCTLLTGALVELDDTPEHLNKMHMTKVIKLNCI
jgi:hypothetical protein